MNPIQESKQELEAAIRYAENSISKANQTIESMATYQEQTGREEALTKLVKELEELNEKLAVDNSNLEKEVQRQQDLGQGYYDSMMTFKEEREMLEKNVKYLRDENERLKREKEASSGPTSKHTATSKSGSTSTTRSSKKWCDRLTYLLCPSSPRT